jgi:hypothetical protein
LRLELAGKCQQFDAGIRLSGLTGSCRFRLEPEIRSPDPFTGILLPWNLRNATEPAVSVPDCSTWVYKII